jgi:hypothetical protein
MEGAGVTSLAPILQGFFTERLAQRRCSQHTITIRKDDLGHLDKFRQDLAYLSSARIGTYKSVRANTVIFSRQKGVLHVV